MTNLADKRVGIIGTGATAVQCIPPLARDAQELFVFQRTPSSIDVRNNHPIDPEWFATLEPGWQHEWLLNFATLQTGGFADEDLVQGRLDRHLAADPRSHRASWSPRATSSRPSSPSARSTRATTRRWRRSAPAVDAIVEDPATAAALKPWYRQLCKRPCFHDEYLQAYNQPNCHLVDTDG